MSPLAGVRGKDDFVGMQMVETAASSWLMITIGSLTSIVLLTVLVTCACCGKSKKRPEPLSLPHLPSVEEKSNGEPTPEMKQETGTKPNQVEPQPPSALPQTAPAPSPLPPPPPPQPQPPVQSVPPPAAAAPKAPGPKAAGKSVAPSAGVKKKQQLPPTPVRYDDPAYRTMGLDLEDPFASSKSGSDKAKGIGAGKIPMKVATKQFGRRATDGRQSGSHSLQI